MLEGLPRREFVQVQQFDIDHGALVLVAEVLVLGPQADLAVGVGVVVEVEVGDHDGGADALEDVQAPDGGVVLVGVGAADPGLAGGGEGPGLAGVGGVGDGGAGLRVLGALVNEVVDAGHDVVAEGLGADQPVQGGQAGHDAAPVWTRVWRIVVAAKRRWRAES